MRVTNKKQLQALEKKGLISPKNTFSISAILEKLDKNKYHAKKVKDSTGKVIADSRIERDYGRDFLPLMEKAGELSEVERWPTVHLTAIIKWKLDYSFIEAGKRVYIDVKGGKGTQDGRFLTLCQLWRTHGPGELRIATYDYKVKVWQHKSIKLLKNNT